MLALLKQQVGILFPDESQEHNEKQSGTFVEITEAQISVLSVLFPITHQIDEQILIYVDIRSLLKKKEAELLFMQRMRYLTVIPDKMNPLTSTDLLDFVSALKYRAFVYRQITLECSKKESKKPENALIYFHKEVSMLELLKNVLQTLAKESVDFAMPNHQLKIHLMLGEAFEDLCAAYQSLSELDLSNRLTIENNILQMRTHKIRILYGFLEMCIKQADERRKSTVLLVGFSRKFLDVCLLKNSPSPVFPKEVQKIINIWKETVCLYEILLLLPYPIFSDGIAPETFVVSTALQVLSSVFEEKVLASLKGLHSKRTI